MLLVALVIALLVPTVPLALAQVEQGAVTVHVLYRGTIPLPACDTCRCLLLCV